jgi:hypothetical protein
VAVFPLGVKVTPVGSVDLVHPAKSALVIALVGDPVDVTVKAPAVPPVNLALLGLVIAGG